MDYTVRGILQARILEWVAVPFSGRSSWPRNQTGVSCIAGILYQLSYQGSPSNKQNKAKQSPSQKSVEKNLMINIQWKWLWDII